MTVTSVPIGDSAENHHHDSAISMPSAAPPVEISALKALADTGRYGDPSRILLQEVEWSNLEDSIERIEFSEGQVWYKPAAMIRSSFDTFNEDGPCVESSWRVGVDSEFCEPDDFEAVCDEIGIEKRTIIAIRSLPKPHQRRIFYIRQFIPPEGPEFGRRNLRVTTLSAFRQWGDAVLCHLIPVRAWLHVEGGE